MNVIERIRQLKNDRGWTDYRLASEAMIPQSTLASIYERNTPPKHLGMLPHAARKEETGASRPSVRERFAPPALTLHLCGHETPE